MENNYVYALIKDSNPIYVGCTSNIKRREFAHKKNKTFDFLFVIKKYDNKKDALCAENAIIRFLSILECPIIENGLFENLFWEKKHKESML